LIEPGRVSILVDAARIDLTLGRFDAAREQFQNALRLSRSGADSMSVYDALEDYYEIRGEYQKAIETMWRRYTTIQHTAPPLRVYLEQLDDMNRYVHAGRQEDAFSAMEEIEANVTAAPYNKWVSFGYVDIYIAQEDPDKAEANMAAIEDLIQSLGLELLRPRCDYSWGRIHELRGDYDEAVAAYDKVLKNDPTEYGGNLGNGRCYRKQGDYQRSETYLVKIAKQRPFDGHTNYELALLYHATGRYPEANEHLDRSLEVWSNADPDYKAAARARETKREWQAQSSM